LATRLSIFNFSSTITNCEDERDATSQGRGHPAYLER
jgi:hypothetical protein